MAQRTIPSEAYNVRVEPVHTPDLDTLRDAVLPALKEDYKEVSVDVVDSPDLTTWGLHQQGLGGPSIVTDHGGEPFCHNPTYRHVRFDMNKIAEALGMPNAPIFGSGCCASESLDGHWGELMVKAHCGQCANSSISARVLTDRQCEAAPYKSMIHGGLCNLFVSEVLPGKVLRVRVKQRIGEQRSLPQTLRRGLGKAFEQAVALGGVFKVVQGKVKTHLQLDLCMCPENYYDPVEEKGVKPALQFYDDETAMGPDLVALSCLWSKDPTGGAMHMRASGEHTHLYSMSQADQGGHYHGDVGDGSSIEYEGYFVPANKLARVRDAVAEAAGDKGNKPAIVVLGAGAMGCLLGGKLAEGGMDVTFVDTWKEHVDKMNQDGLKLVGKGGDRTLSVKATTDPSSLTSADVIIVQCKSKDTRDAVTAVKHLVRKDTVAVSFQNGLGNEDIMAEVLGIEHTFGGQTLEGANVEGPGCVRIHTDLSSVMGEWAGGASARCGRLCAIFSQHGLHTYEDADMRKKIWMKVIYNCVVSPLSTITNMTHKDIYVHDDAIKIAEVITKEALAVARAEGLNITDAEAKDCLDKVIASKQSNKSSMCMDFLAKRVSEMDFINNRIATLAVEHGIDVPMNRAMVFMVKCLETHFTHVSTAPIYPYKGTGWEAMQTHPKVARSFTPAEKGNKYSVAVLGGGPIASVLAGKLAAGGLDVTIISTCEDHVEAINRQGLVLLGAGGNRTVHVKATADISSVSPVDIIIVQCNSNETKAAAFLAKSLAGENTAVVSFQNGIGNEETLAEVFGVEHVFGGTTLEGGIIEKPGVVRVTTDNLTSCMGKWPAGSSVKCRNLCDVFSKHGLRTKEEPDIRKQIWIKAAYNCATSPLSALTNLTHKELLFEDGGRDFAYAIIREFVAVANSEDLPISEEEARECLNKVIATQQPTKSSMCNDLLARLPTELDFMNGRIVDLAEKHKINAPFNAAVTFFVRALESHFVEKAFDNPRLNPKRMRTHAPEVALLRGA